MKAKNWKNLLIASVLLASAATAIYLAAMPYDNASAPVTAVDLSDPVAVQEAMAFDPFEAGDTVAALDLGRGGVAIGAGSGSADTADQRAESIAPEIAGDAQSPLEEVASVQPHGEELAATDGPPAAHSMARGAPTVATLASVATGATGAAAARWAKLVKFVRTPLGMAVTAAGIGGVTVGSVAIANSSGSSSRSPS